MNGNNLVRVSGCRLNGPEDLAESKEELTDDVLRNLAFRGSMNPNELLKFLQTPYGEPFFEKAMKDQGHWMHLFFDRVWNFLHSPSFYASVHARDH